MAIRSLATPATVGIYVTAVRLSNLSSQSRAIVLYRSCDLEYNYNSNFLRKYFTSRQVHVERGGKRRKHRERMATFQTIVVVPIRRRVSVAVR